MIRRRSPAITVLGVANMVLGTLGILCACTNGGWMLFMSLVSENDADPLMKDLTEPWNFMVRNVPGYLQIEIAMAIFHLAISILAIVSGVALLSLKNWGRVLAVLYGFTMILVEGAYLLFFFAFVNPVLKQGPHQDGLLGSGALDVVGSLIILIYATVLVIVLYLPAITAEFAGTRGHLPEEDW